MAGLFVLPSQRSVPWGRRATPAEAVVYADFGGMFIIPKPGANDRGWAAGEGGAAEIIVLVLRLGGPVRREHVFETGPHSVAVLVGVVGGKSRGYPGDGNTEIGIVAPGVAALAVEQRGTPGVANPAGGRAQLVVVAGHHSATREEHTIVVVGNPAVLGFRADHPVWRELIVEAALHAAHKPGAASRQAGAVSERAAEMPADIETGPIVDSLRGRIDRLPGIGPRRNISCERGSCENDKGSSAEQEFLHS